MGRETLGRRAKRGTPAKTSLRSQANANRTSKDATRPSLPPSRAGKKPVTAYVEKTTHKELRLLGIELEKSTQEMLTEALNDYLSRYR